MLGDPPSVFVCGVTRSSPLGMLLAARVAAPANLQFDVFPATAPDHWMRSAAGTSLQWWSSDTEGGASSPAAHGADITVDFFNAFDSSVSPTALRWCVVDAMGEAVATSYALLDKCCRAPFVASVFLIENKAGESRWTIHDEAYVSSCLRYAALLDRVADTATRIISSTLRHGPKGNRRTLDALPAIRTRSELQILAAQVRARVSRAALAFCDAAFSERWAIGVLHGSDESLTRSGVIRPKRWLKCSSGSYFADPFPCTDGANVILCEKFDQRNEIGQLRALTVSGRHVVRDEPVDLNVGKVHLSYPFTFRENGRTFVLPEMAAAGKLALFEAGSQTALEPVCVVNTGTRIADPTLFAHGGLYWIAYTDQDIGTDDNLCLLYAQRLEGPWLAHERNPVKIDIRSSRPAGTPFVHRGQLYRPAQNCAGTYGRAVIVNVVRCCTPVRYEEEPAAVLSADPHGDFPHGLHTISIANSTILIDGKIFCFDLARLWKRIKKRAARR